MIQEGVCCMLLCFSNVVRQRGSLQLQKHRVVEGQHNAERAHPHCTRVSIKMQSVEIGLSKGSCVTRVSSSGWVTGWEVQCAGQEWEGAGENLAKCKFVLRIVLYSK